MPGTLIHIVPTFPGHLCKKYDYGEHLLFFLYYEDLVTEPHKKNLGC